MKSTIIKFASGLCAAMCALSLASAAMAGTTSYVYDALGRVIQVTSPDGVVTTYTYDAAGNRVSKVVSTNSGNKWGSFTWGQGKW